jgi:hypothetical protein
MQLGLWLVFFVICNLVGVKVFTAALTLPADEALVPAILTVPLIMLAALGASRLAEAWSSRDD